MKIFVDSNYRGIWDDIVNDPFVPRKKNQHMPQRLWMETPVGCCDCDKYKRPIYCKQLDTNLM